MSLNEIIQVCLLISLLSIVPWLWLFTALKISLGYLDN